MHALYFEGTLRDWVGLFHAVWHLAENEAMAPWAHRVLWLLLHVVEHVGKFVKKDADKPPINAAAVEAAARGALGPLRGNDTWRHFFRSRTSSDGVLYIVGFALLFFPAQCGYFVLRPLDKPFADDKDGQKDQGDC